MPFEDEYKKILSSEALARDFTSTKKDNRVYTFLNVNCRDLLLYFEYLFNKNYTDNKEKDKHHIDALLKRMNLYVDTGRYKKNKNRVNILNKIKDKNNIFKKYFVVLMSFGTNEQVNDKYMDLTNTLSPEVTDYLYRNIKDIKNEHYKILNPLYGYFVFYNTKNKKIIDEYLDSIDDNSIKKILKETADNKKSLINLKIHNFSDAFFKEEMEITGIIKSLIDVQLNSAKTKEEAIILLIDAIRKYVSETELYAVKEPEWTELKEILHSLTKNEYNSFLKPVIDTLKGDEFVSSAISLSFDRGAIGEDVLSKTKTRRGQKKFKNSLIAINKADNKGVCKCSVERCKISNNNFLIASHIKEWSDSNCREKVDGYNGLLLCPVHDYLFDKHLITFDKDSGSIRISNSIDTIIYEHFNIRTSDRIKVRKNQKKYLEIHNSKLK